MNLIDSLSEALFGGIQSPSPSPPAMGFGDTMRALTSGGPGGIRSQSGGFAQMGGMNGGFSSLGAPALRSGNGLADALGAILRGSGSVPQRSAAPPREAERLPWQQTEQRSGPTPSPAGAPESGSGITGNDVASFIRSVMTGAASVDPSRPGISAFAQGASGAMNARDALSDKEKAARIADEDREMKIDDRAFDRAKDIRGESRADSREKREGRLNEIKMLEATAKVMRDVDPSLDIKDRIAVERLVRDEGKRLMDAESLSGEELQTAMETYRKDIEGRLTANKPRITGAQPGPAAKSGTGATSKAPTGSGDGKSQSSPAAPVDKSAFDALPSGAWFVNPADGRVLQKK